MAYAIMGIISSLYNWLSGLVVRVTALGSQGCLVKGSDVKVFRNVKLKYIVVNFDIKRTFCQ